MGATQTIKPQCTQADFEQWVDLYSAEFYAYALNVLSDVELAKDTLQECFLAAIQSFENFKGESQVKSWLYSILRYKCMDQLRLKYKKIEHNENLDQAIEEYSFSGSGSWENRASPMHDWTPLLKRDQQRLEEFLEQCLKILPPKWYEALRLQFLMEEVKLNGRKELGLSDANFWQVIRRAKLQMRSCLEQKGIEKGDLT